MNNVWLKVKVWTKAAIFGLVLVYVIVFVANNSAERVKVWFWLNVMPETTVLLLVLYAFLAGVLVTILARTLARTFRQFRELQERQRADRLERELGEMKSKAAMLRAKPDGTGAGGASDVG